MKKKRMKRPAGKMTGKHWLLSASLCCYSVLSGLVAKAQNGEAGIQEATNKVVGYFDTGCDLMYAIGAVVGLIGAVKVLCAMNVLAA